MPSRGRRKPTVRRIPLTDLVARPDHANVLTARKRTALGEHIARHGWYPALIVRPHPDLPGKYEILDGHHRKEILDSQGASSARCEVWPAADGDADVLVATLNDLRGRPDGKRRARQVRAMVSRFGRETAAARLGITTRALDQQLAPLTPPRREEGPPALDLEAVVFHLSGDEAKLLRRALRAAGAGRLRRGEALMEVVRRGIGAAGRPKSRKPMPGCPSRTARRNCHRSRQ